MWENLYTVFFSSEHRSVFSDLILDWSSIHTSFTPLKVNLV